MPRQPRLNLENGVYHVTQRGLERRDIALTEDDRRQWLRLLDRHATRCGWRVFADALLVTSGVRHRKIQKRRDRVMFARHAFLPPILNFAVPDPSRALPLARVSSKDP